MSLCCPSGSSPTGGVQTDTDSSYDLEDVREELPEHLVVGTGAYGQMRPDPKAVELLQREGIQVEALPFAVTASSIPAERQRHST